MRYLLLALSLQLFPTTPALAQIRLDIGSPGVDIGINVGTYPSLVLVPGYPVYYDPRASSNYFFYDGLYWVFQGDEWYASSWYDGPWQPVAREQVPVLVLRVPVRYYRQPPPYFRGWRADAPPRWGQHWGRGWEERRAGWDRWDRRSAPRPSPLPVYQRRYSGDRYPRAAEQQHAIRSGNYRYEPREPVARQHFQSSPPQLQRPRAEPQGYGGPPQRAEPQGNGGPPQRAELRRDPRDDGPGSRGHERESRKDGHGRERERDREHERP